MTVEILAPGNSDAPSGDIVVAAGAMVTVGIFAAVDAALPLNAKFVVEKLTPGAANRIYELRDRDRFYVLDAPGTYRVRRRAYAGTAFGVYRSPA